MSEISSLQAAILRGSRIRTLYRSGSCDVVGAEERPVTYKRALPKMFVDISRSHGMPVHIPTCRASSTFAGRLRFEHDAYLSEDRSLNGACPSFPYAVHGRCRYTGSQPRTTPLKATFDHKQQSITLRSEIVVGERDSMHSVAPSQSRVNRRLMLSSIALLGLLSTGQDDSAQQTDLAEPVKAAKGLIEGEYL